MCLTLKYNYKYLYNNTKSANHFFPDVEGFMEVLWNVLINGILKENIPCPAFLKKRAQDNGYIPHGATDKQFQEKLSEDLSRDNISAFDLKHLRNKAVSF